MEAVEGSHNPYPVTPAGFLIGSYIALALFGVHSTQLYTYFSTYNDPRRTKLLVIWIYTLSTLQIIIIIGSGWKYYVDGIQNPRIWGTFLWPLSFQDALIPLMAFTGQLYFGRRAWIVWGRRRWFGIFVLVLPTVTLACGIALAITARLWADNPFVSVLEWEHETKVIGNQSTIVAITWMGLSAFTDGTITLLLLLKFRQTYRNSPRLVTRLTALTLETVLLTHMCGAAMCVIFLASDPKHRTDKDIFWVLIEIITELYALSMLFTINARRDLRRAGGEVVTADLSVYKSPPELHHGVAASEIERQVEGRRSDSRLDVFVGPILLRGNGTSDSEHLMGSAKGARGPDRYPQSEMIALGSMSSDSAPSPLVPKTPSFETEQQPRMEYHVRSTCSDVEEADKESL